MKNETGERREKERIGCGKTAEESLREAELAKEKRLQKTERKRFLCIQIAMFVLVFGLGMIYLTSKRWMDDRTVRNLFKAVASLAFVFCCAVNLFFARVGRRKTGGETENRASAYGAWLLLGQAFACAGDIVLCFHFAAGAALFGIGHLFFLAGFVSIKGCTLRDFLCAGLVAVFSFCTLVFYPRFDFDGLKIVVFVYAAVISAMLGKALSLACDRTLAPRLRLVLLAGAGLFFFSDLMLVFHKFAAAGELADWLCLVAYYPAEYLLALSVSVAARLAPLRKRAVASRLSVWKRAGCRFFQAVFRLAIPFLPYRKPKLLADTKETVALLKRAGADKALLVTDGGVYGAGLTSALEKACAEAGVGVCVYKDTVANPTTADVEKARAMYENNACKAIIAFGGGSAMDCAKATGARIVNPKKSLQKMKGVLRIFRRLPLLIAVPTTAGTGSETTLAAVITDERTRHKYPINAFCLIPRYALLDETLTFGLPPFYTATTGMDALTHAVEAYIGRSTTRETRRAAEEAVKLIAAYLPRAYADGEDAIARKGMQRAAYLAGVAFTKSYVGYVHAVAHSLGGRYGIPHGLANAVILPYFLEEYGEEIYPALARLAVCADMATREEAKKDKEDAAKRFIGFVKKLNADMGIPDKLSGIRAGDIPSLAETAAKEANPLYPVPKIMSAKELEMTYHKISAEKYGGDEATTGAGKSDFAAVLTGQKEYFASGATLDVSRRIAALKNLYAAICEAEEEINAALQADLGKCAFESYMCEVGLTLTEISYMIRHVRRFSKDKRVKTPLAQFAAKSFVRRSPLGCVLVMSPWNYPFLLTMEPLADALAAGNTVVVKPSAYSPAVSLVMGKLLRRTFPPSLVAVAEGGRAENAALLELPFDKIFFTGSVAVGKEVMRMAAERLVPVTLELGGKSPCIVDETANLALAAKRIVFGKFLNVGQTCVAPDYVYVASSVRENFLAEVKKQIVLQYGEAPLYDPTYGKIVSSKHFARVCALIDDKKVVYGGGRDESNLKIEPTVMDGVTWDDAAMGEEIFGPVMPVLTFDGIGDVMAEINARPSPLALYIFSSDKKTVDRVLNGCRFGGGCVNDTIIHLATSEMAFGGVGNSGMGSYHGRKGFECFTHEKSIVDKKTFIDLPMRYRPYRGTWEKLLRFFLK